MNDFSWSRGTEKTMLEQQRMDKRLYNNSISRSRSLSWLKHVLCHLWVHVPLTRYRYRYEKGIFQVNCCLRKSSFFFLFSEVLFIICNILSMIQVYLQQNSVHYIWIFEYKDKNNSTQIRETKFLLSISNISREKIITGISLFSSPKYYTATACSF